MKVKSSLLYLIIYLACLFNGKAQQSYHICLSVGSFSGKSVAFLSLPFKVDSLLNKKEEVITQFKQELMLSYLNIYIQNSNRFEQVLLEKQADSTKAFIRYNFLKDGLLQKGFELKPINFHFYADSAAILKTKNKLSNADSASLQPYLNSIVTAKNQYQAKRVEVEATKKFINRKQSAKEGWVEVVPGSCKAGGPPPRCPVQHWRKASVAEAMAFYEQFLEQELKQEKAAITQAENNYRLAATGKLKDKNSKANPSPAKLQYYYYAKAINYDLRETVVGPIFVAEVSSKTDEKLLDLFLETVARENASLYNAGKQTIYDLSEPFESWSAAMASRRAYLANWKYVYGYKGKFLP